MDFCIFFLGWLIISLPLKKKKIPILTFYIFSHNLQNHVRAHAAFVILLIPKNKIHISTQNTSRTLFLIRASFQEQ